MQAVWQKKEALLQKRFTNRQKYDTKTKNQENKEQVNTVSNYPKEEKDKMLLKWYKQHR